MSQNSPFVRQARYPTLPLSTNPKSSGAPSFALLRRVGCKPFAPQFSLNRPQNYGCPTSRFSDVRKYTFPASSCRRPLSLPVLSSLLITRCSLLVHKNAFAFTYPQPTHPALIPHSSPFLFSPLPFSASSAHLCALRVRLASPSLQANPITQTIFHAFTQQNRMSSPQTH